MSALCRTLTIVLIILLTRTAAPDDSDAAVSQPLEKKISLEFAVSSLENAIKALAEKAGDGLEIQILGEDLKLDGITRNQAIRNFKAVDRPVAEVLTSLLIRGNPNSRVAEPNDPLLQLIWIMR